MNKAETFNVMKGIALVAAILYGGFLVLAAFSPKPTGPAIEYIYVYTTINGHYYAKEATTADLNSDFVTFEDGTRVSWAVVKSKKMKVYPTDLHSTKQNR